MTLPPRPLRIRSRAEFRLSSKIAVAFRVITAFQSSSERSTAAPRRLMPVDQYLRRAPQRAHALKPLRDPSSLRKIIRRYVNFLCELPKLGCCALKFSKVASHKNHVDPGLRQSVRRCGADSSGATGDDGKLAFQREGIHAVSCPAMREISCIAKSTKGRT
jgi:hypothetical protein